LYDVELPAEKEVNVFPSWTT